MSTVGTAWRDTSLSGNSKFEYSALNGTWYNDDDDYRIKEGNVSNLACPTDKCQSQILPTQVMKQMMMMMMVYLMIIRQIILMNDDHVLAGVRAGDCGAVREI